MKYTGNLKLLKPEGNDPAGWQAFNDNSDILDRVIIQNTKDNNIFLKDKQILANEWRLGTSFNIYYIDFSDTRITKDSIVEINISIQDKLNGADKDIYSTNDSFDGYVRLYSKYRPTKTINFDALIKKEVK